MSRNSTEWKDRPSFPDTHFVSTEIYTSDQIFREEQEKIFSKLDQDNFSAEEKAFFMDQLRRPLNVAELAASAQTPEQAAEIYTASVLAIQPDTPSEISYLNNLAIALKLDPGLRSNIDAVVKTG